MPIVIRAPRLPKSALKPKDTDKHRGSARERGYSTAWDKLSARLRRQRPFCEECARYGEFRETAVIDHKLPLRHGGERYVLENLWALCAICHTGMKARLEAIAERMDSLDLLPIWCDEPDSRPREERGRIRRW